jgi:hypothetical protein
MARRTIKCGVGEKRFTVLRIDRSAYDTHAARSFERALALAQPNRGSTVDVFAVCASDAGAARLPSVYERRGELLRRFRYKGGR